ncbi:MAG: DNA double-strand break repair nuclease NurA [Geminicoccaceae bacterium]|nr:DNA double-strand break repair nuclease NurA [Geminicoccaceae bacterium]MCX7631431.1 DNA double-strand break repair nuclease NurA [Geminicoccaceae bacterium]MDW8124730.1 hypothetical protein [Geminicoccaceae bacterium]
MLGPADYRDLESELERQLAEDRCLLDELRDDVRTGLGPPKRIQPRSSTAISVVATDGGNNQLRFDPFLIQLVRVVDSSANEYCLEIVSPTMSVRRLSQRQLSGREGPTPLGRMMQFLGVADLSELSPMIPPDAPGRLRSPSWIQVYRELVEWAVLLAIAREKDFATDTVIVFDGLLRSKVFAGDLFARYRSGLRDAIDLQYQRRRRQLFVVGLAKRSKVLDRYRLAMALEGIMQEPFPCFVEVPRALEEKVYRWSEYARGDDRAAEGGEINKFVAGKLFFVKFGHGRYDPIWPVDILQDQADLADTIFGCLLADARDGFPIPLYPRSLQKAHENAALMDFDAAVLQDMILDTLRKGLGSDCGIFDEFRLLDDDLTPRRYG